MGFFWFLFGCSITLNIFLVIGKLKSKVSTAYTDIVSSDSFKDKFYDDEIDDSEVAEDFLKDNNKVDFSSLIRR